MSPGHVFPIIAKDGGVLVRAGHTEASVDISKLAKKNNSAVICEIMNEDGTMAKGQDLFNFANKHKLKIGKIEDLISYRLKKEKLIKLKKSSYIKFKNQNYKIKIYENLLDLLPEGYILNLEIIFPNGKFLAERTSNKSFGIVEGLSIIGTSAETFSSASPNQLKNAKMESVGSRSESIFSSFGCGNVSPQLHPVLFRKISYNILQLVQVFVHMDTGAKKLRGRAGVCTWEK